MPPERSQAVPFAAQEASRLTYSFVCGISQHVKNNPYAQRQFDQVTPEEVMNSRQPYPLTSGSN
jgi:hypothetical protein